jgi:hypothetical protein
MGGHFLVIMKRRIKRMPIPQWEFGFARDSFNLIAESGLDGERLSRERQELERSKEAAATAQNTLFVLKPKETK